MVAKTEITIKAYDRKPYEIKKSHKKVRPKRTKKHPRLIESVLNISKDIKKTLADSKKHYRLEQKRIKKEKIQLEREIEKAKDREATKDLNELRRKRQSLEAKHRFIAERIAGIKDVDEFRRSRLTVIPGSPLSQRIGALKGRQEYESVRDDIFMKRLATKKAAQDIRGMRVDDEVALRGARSKEAAVRKASLEAMQRKGTGLQTLRDAIGKLSGAMKAPVEEAKAAELRKETQKGKMALTHKQYVTGAKARAASNATQRKHFKKIVDSVESLRKTVKLVIDQHGPESEEPDQAKVEKAERDHAAAVEQMQKSYPEYLGGGGSG